MDLRRRHNRVTDLLLEPGCGLRTLKAIIEVQIVPEEDLASELCLAMLCAIANLRERIRRLADGGKLGGKSGHREKTDRAGDHHGAGRSDPCSDRTE